MRFGIQLFGVLSSTRTGVMETLRQLREMGFDWIEPCLSMEPIPGMERVIWPEEWFRAHAEEIRAMGLESVSSHVFAEDLAAAAGRLKDLAVRYGIRQFVVKTPRDMSGESLQQAALTYMRTADVLAEAGAELLLHNELADMSARDRDRSAYERLLDLCMGKVGAQVDAGWAWAAGEDPEALLWRLGPLVKSLHYKPLVREGEKLVPAVIGRGQTDDAACFQFARAMGIPQIVDADEFPGDPMQFCGQCLAALRGLGQSRERTVSYLNVLDTVTGRVRTLRRFDRIIEAPNWLKGSERIIYNSEGHIYAYDLADGTETLIETGTCDNCNNDHVIAPDESQIAVSHSDRATPWASRVYVLPIRGGQPRLVTENAPSYLHGWSPDGGELAYCAFREHGGRLEADIYTIPAGGGEEKRLTGGGFNDGPEYSPEGRYIWFNSTRSGLMQLWRMERDGSGQTRMTATERNNWFGHVSPDGKKVAYLSYRKGDLDPAEHLPNMQVQLWVMNADGSEAYPVASLFGGQGTMNVNSWAGDSRHLAFVSYELLHK